MTKLIQAALFVALPATLAIAQVPAPLATPDGQASLLRVHHEMTDTGAPVQLLASLPSDTWTINDWYKQNVYDLGNNKIGEIVDLLLDHEGKTAAIIIGVGGFVGVGEKDVAVPFNAVAFKKKDNDQWYPVMNTTKDALKSAPGYKYDRTARKWMPEQASGTIGGPAPQNAR